MMFRSFIACVALGADALSMDDDSAVGAVRPVGDASAGEEGKEGGSGEALHASDELLVEVAAAASALTDGQRGPVPSLPPSPPQFPEAARSPAAGRDDDAQVGQLLQDSQRARDGGKVVLEILIGGQSGVGKTSLAKAWSAGSAYQMAPDQTPLVDMFVSELDQPTQKFEYRVYDVAGHDRFGRGSQVVSSMVRQTRTFMIAYDVSQPSTFTDAVEWKANLEAKGAMDGVKWMLLATKFDKVKDAKLDTAWLRENYNGILDPEDLSDLSNNANQVYANMVKVFSKASKRAGFDAWWPVSAHTYLGVQECFDWAFSSAQVHLDEHGVSNLESGGGAGGAIQLNDSGAGCRRVGLGGCC